jgi:hypothetical protein
MPIKNIILTLLFLSFQTITPADLSTIPEEGLTEDQIEQILNDTLHRLKAEPIASEMLLKHIPLSYKWKHILKKSSPYGDETRCLIKKNYDFLKALNPVNKAEFHAGWNRYQEYYRKEYPQGKETPIEIVTFNNQINGILDSALAEMAAQEFKKGSINFPDAPFERPFETDLGTLEDQLAIAEETRKALEEFQDDLVEKDENSILYLQLRKHPWYKLHSDKKLLELIYDAIDNAIVDADTYIEIIGEDIEEEEEEEEALNKLTKPVD